jgi:hypothetical protein
VSQRAALLSIYGSLGSTTDDRAHRRALFGEPAEGAAETVATSAEEVVLEAEILEVVVALSLDRSFGNRAAFVADQQLQHLAARLVTDRAKTSELLGVVFDIRDQEDLTASRPLLPKGGVGGSGPQRAAPDPPPVHLDQAPPTTLDIARGALIKAGVDLAPALLAQPGARCQARLVPVSIEGEGEYAVSFRTDVCFEMPLGFSVADFVADLFEPSQWPKRHSFWCSMTEVPDIDLPPSALELLARMQEAQAFGEQAGAIYGPRRVFTEVVGNCENPGGTWPNTVLVFTPSHVAGTNGEPNRHYLEYRLVPGVSDYLELDDGTIQVVEDGTNVCCTITKMLYFNETQHSTQAELMAEYACVSGWADQTRLFLTHWMDENQ